MLRCEKCKHMEVSGEKYPCSECDSIVNDLFESKKKTNADRIRSMSDEELAEFISKVNRTCIVDALGGDTQCDYEDVNCTECKAKFCGIQKWLQSEVE